MRFRPDIELWPGLWRHSAAIFLAMLVLFYVTEPYVERTGYEKVVRSATFTLVLLAGTTAVGARKAVMFWAVAFATPTILLLWVNHLRPDLLPRGYPIATAFLFSLFVMVRLVRFILRAPVVDSEVLCAAVAGYLMSALAFALLYTLIGEVDSQAFAWTVETGARHKLDNFVAIYFSLTTQATLGYGDIVPVSPTSRLLTMIQAVGGMFYMTLLVARLVSAYTSGPKIEKP